MRRSAFALAAVGLVAWTGIASAQDDESPRQRAIDLATIEIMNEVCHLDLAPTQEDAIAAARSAMIDNGSIEPRDIAAIHDQLETTMQSEVGEGLCRPEGAAVKEYKRQVALLGAQ